MDKTKHRGQVKMPPHLGDFGFANQTLHQTPDSSAVLVGAGGGAGELIGTRLKRNYVNKRHFGPSTESSQTQKG